MLIFLYGPPGAGKSSTGQALAQALHLPFTDLDQALEAQAGLQIPQIMARHGESAFRDREAEALARAAAEPEGVIALGGGALLRESSRALAEARGQVVVLNAGLETLLQRTSAAPEQRPLLAGDLRTKLAALLAQRADHYASFPLQVRVDALTPDEAAAQARVLLGRHHLTAMGEYDVRVETVSQAGPGLAAQLIVTDENVAALHLETVRRALGRDLPAVVIPAGEAHKTLETVASLWQGFLQHGLDRKSTVLALGGGVISDLTGFAASTYMRGIGWIAVPTTLLAMVDAALGGKTGFDLPAGKNLIGSFHPPRLVLADPGLLLTLSDRELRSGMAEVVKHGLLADPGLFDLCARGLTWVQAHLTEVVKRALAVKIHYIETDPYEKGIRAALNLGHTVGHAVELVSRFELRHGEAIAIGTVAEARYAERIGRAEPGLAGRIAHTFSALGLPTDIPSDLPRADILRAMRVDKKKTARAIRFALPVAVGRVDLVEVDDLEAVL